MFASTSLLTRPLCTGGILRYFTKGAVCCASGGTTSKQPRASNESLIQWDKLPIPKSTSKDRWTAKRALFGENDYKDLLGDGTYQLKNNVKVGPLWMRGWKGNELQTLIVKNKLRGHEMGPTKRYALLKRIKYLYRKMNKNRGRWYYKDTYIPNYRDRM